MSSLEKHISKGYQYFGAAHIYSVSVQNIFIFTCALKPETTCDCLIMWYQIIFKGKTYIFTLMMVSIVDFIYTLDKILIKLTHCSLELITEKLNGVSWFSDIGADSINLVIYWIYFTHTYKAYSYRAMLMENASLERIPLHIFFLKKDLENVDMITLDLLFFNTVPFPIISQCLVFPVLGIKLSETYMLSIFGNCS